jgi:UDP-hydrolysing UDP-N-acetyl-D-glucosamine 2-epimerase
MRLLVVTGSRADFGLWRPVLDELDRRAVPDLEVGLLVTGMHLDERFGFTASEVRSSGHAVMAEIPFTPGGGPGDDTRTAMAAALGVAISAMAPTIDESEADWILLLGDRGEQLAAGLVALHLGIAVAHLHGGERTLGAIDDAFRDMITRIAHLHLVADRSAAERLLSLGEARWRIHVTGAPGLDDLAAAAATDPDELRRRLNVGSQPYALVIQHPETVGDDDPVAALDAILGALSDAQLPAVAILPNSDAGGRSLHDALLRRGSELRAVVASLPRHEYAALLAGATVLVGNSSSGIIEAPLLRVPAVNVGERQRGRLRGDNVLDVPARREAIRDAIETARRPEYRAGLSGVSPYGSGDAAARIVDALLAQPIDERLLVKEVA